MKNPGLRRNFRDSDLKEESKKEEVLLEDMSNSMNGID